MYADGEATVKQLEAAASLGSPPGEFGYDPEVQAVQQLALKAPRTVAVAASSDVCCAVGGHGSGFGAAFDGERAAQCDLLRCIFGNPFQPLAVRSFTPGVLRLAQACYASFPEVASEFGVLADALDDLGEEAAATHCREKLHVKGCHILDWVLGKS
jgi:hypothetical protein